MPFYDIFKFLNSFKTNFYYSWCLNIIFFCRLTPEAKGLNSKNDLFSSKWANGADARRNAYLAPQFFNWASLDMLSRLLIYLGSKLAYLLEVQLKLIKVGLIVSHKDLCRWTLSEVSFTSSNIKLWLLSKNNQFKRIRQNCIIYF